MAALSIADAVGKLDPANDEHWTEDGLPRVDAVTKLVGRPVVRREVTEAAPKATRAAAQPEAPPAPPQPPPPQPGPPALPPAPAAASFLADDVDAAAVSPAGDDVLELPRNEVYKSLDLVERAMAEIDRRALVLARRRDRVMAGLNDLSRQTAYLEAAKNALERNGAQSKDSGVRAYLDRQKTVRLERARRAQRFIEAGTTPGDVVAQLANKSRLDAVMGQRRPGMGGTRPVYPVPQQ